MRKTFFAFVYFLFLLVLSGFTFAQSVNSVYSIPGNNGIFINFSNRINISSSALKSNFRIIRIDKPGKESKIAEISTVTSKDEFVKNLQKDKNILKDFPIPGERGINYIWEKLRKTGTIDSVAFWGAFPIVKIALGLMFFDSTAIMNEEYRYKISGSDFGSKPFTIVTNPTKFPGSVKFGRLIKSNHPSDKKQVFIVWKINSGNKPSNFQVLRRDNGKGDYNIVNTIKGFNSNNNTTSLIVRDTTVLPYNFYNYFIVPENLYGNKGVASDTIFTGTYNFNTVAIPFNITAVSSDSLGGILLSWILPQPGLVVSVKIYKSDNYDSNYVQLSEVSPIKTDYLDLMVKPMETYYYYFQITGTLGETSMKSARVPAIYMSKEKPIPSVNITAEGLRNGVKLTWENSEEYIEGFRVYRSTGYRDSLKLISDLLTEQKPVNSFVDSSKELSGKLTYYYAVKSFSTSHVSSDFSDTVSVRPLIPTKPPAATGLTGYIENNITNISWDDVHQNDNSVLGYLVLRRELDKNMKAISDYKSITDSILSYNHNEYKDTTIEQGSYYEYAVVALDMFGGQSDVSNSYLIDFPFPKPSPPGGLRLLPLPGGVKLIWDRIYKDNIVEYKIYRQQLGKKSKYIISVKSVKKLFITDKHLSKNKIYFYFVTSVNKHGIESSFSQPVSIKF
ncbi:fibronectin type III domain protein [bacterium BMS3Abin04]|nr:fibronectin type III domain protein [bacterium BMS3Abin04]